MFSFPATSSTQTAEAGVHRVKNLKRILCLQHQRESCAPQLLTFSTYPNSLTAPIHRVKSLRCKGHV